ncbi:MAG: M15 family metallopeptidase [Cellvibrionaceae bacterium]|nr:M15 family metallopeptidase [Cellvibrionaceae bacterium]
MKSVRFSDQMSVAQWQNMALGCSDQHLCAVAPKVLLHKDILQPWQALCLAARDAGFTLRIASGYRSFERQLHIWDQKLSGRRPVYDCQNRPLSLDEMPSLARVKALMRWSALPGASRHHWGTDIDIYDASAVSADYRLQLLPDEYRGTGPFAPMMAWLEAYISTAATGFFFPYRRDNGGVAPEPWHVSYRPLAAQFQRVWSLDLLRQQLNVSHFAEKQTVLSHLDELYRVFIKDAMTSYAD